MPLTIKLQSECWDNEKQEFFYPEVGTLTLEHSLISISKWESKWKKPFIHQTELSIEELKDYVRCMTLTQNVKPEVYNALTAPMLNEIVAYMNEQQTATWFSNPTDNKQKNGEVITSELVYYWMTAANIPKECEKWHFSRLMTLIRIAGEKNQPPKKMKKNDIYKQNHALNAMRRAKLKSRG